MTGPLANAHTVTKLPAQDLERARVFYREKLGLEPVEERAGGLRYVCGRRSFTSSVRQGPRRGNRPRWPSKSMTSTRPGPT